MIIIVVLFMLNFENYLMIKNYLFHFENTPMDLFVLDIQLIARIITARDDHAQLCLIIDHMKWNLTVEIDD